jgi:hypothetical protein
MAKLRAASTREEVSRCYEQTSHCRLQNGDLINGIPASGKSTITRRYRKPLACRS